MKLPDFSQSPALNSLREQMGAGRISWSSETSWKEISFEEIERLSTEGIDVSWKEVDILDDGALVWKGQRVVVYIRDQLARFFYSRSGEKRNGYKYHLVDCDTLQEMRRKRREERYVISTRRTGRFKVNVLDDARRLHEEHDQHEMPVCIYCLKILNHENYNTVKSAIKKSIVNDFNLKSFFDRYDSAIRKIPRHDENSAPLQAYPDGWRDLSRAFRLKRKFTCESCGLVLDKPEELQQFTHSHHWDGDLSNNHEMNLACLCAYCHSKQPGHDHMRERPAYRRFEIKLREIGSYDDARRRWLRTWGS